MERSPDSIDDIPTSEAVHRMIPGATGGAFIFATDVELAGAVGARQRLVDVFPKVVVAWKPSDALRFLSVVSRKVVHVAAAEHDAFKRSLTLADGSEVNGVFRCPGDLLDYFVSLDDAKRSEVMTVCSSKGVSGAEQASSDLKTVAERARELQRPAFLVLTA